MSNEIQQQPPAPKKGGRVYVRLPVFGIAAAIVGDTDEFGDFTATCSFKVRWCDRQGTGEWAAVNPKTETGHDPLPAVGDAVGVTIWVGRDEYGEPDFKVGKSYKLTAEVVEVDYDEDPGESDGNAWVRIGPHEVFVRSDCSDAWVNAEGCCDPDDPVAEYLRTAEGAQ